MRREVFLTLGILSGVVAFCVGGFVWFASGFANRIPPETYPLQRVTGLLQAIELHPGEVISASYLTDTPLEVVEACWQFLQHAMALNDNRYEIIRVDVFGDYGTPGANVTGTDEVVIEVGFPDGTRARMEFYAAYFVLCREVKDDA